CLNCGVTHTPLWRKGLNNELNCNAGGLYCQSAYLSPRLHHVTNRLQFLHFFISPAVTAKCYNCNTTTTPPWRKDDEGKTVCNVCGLYFKLHRSPRLISMKSDVIRKRSRHEARRASISSRNAPHTPSASPGTSRRTSPTSGQDGTNNSNSLSPQSSPPIRPRR
ncbi:glucocorticoid receptor-like protein, partial [Stereum hirsutum FP-91666 SS1]